MTQYTNRLLWLLLLTLSITSCKVSKDVATPQAAIPAQFRDVAADSGSAAIAETRWDMFFTDATLLGLIDSALQHNLDMQIALKNIDAAQLLYRQSKWGYAPDLRALLSAGSNRPSDNSLNGISASQFLGTTHIEDFNASLSLSWEADIWGKIRSQKKKAQAEYLQTIEARNTIQTGLVANVAQTYYTLLMLDAQLHTATQNLALLDSTLRIIQLQFDAGLVTVLAVQQAQAQRLAAAQLVPSLVRDSRIQENALSILCGTAPHGIQRSTSLETLPLPEEPQTGVPAAMVARRPDVRSQELALRAANARVGIAKASMYPSLNITAAGGINSFKASNWFSIPASLFGSAAGSLVQPLLMKRQLKTQYKVALIDREKVVLQFRQSVLLAVGEVSDALVKVEQLRTQQQMASDRVQTLQEAIGQAQMLFANGMANYLEVITAQGNLLQSELELATIRRARLSAMVDLYRSLGGGWQ
jgi:NodT family efflux transporter outer membrane factor (OMF) lipoprotein